MELRVALLEDDICKIAQKIDGALKRMEVMEVGRRQKSEAMDAIFDPTRRDSVLPKVAADSS